MLSGSCEHNCDPQYQSQINSGKSIKASFQTEDEMPDGDRLSYSRDSPQK